ncbi:polysaccharide deacetylase family protein [Maribacter chungangensis]|uniref:Polysaccharide deacetylase family protein n=1 Tax=Maribacter chungangensis TaxID=1069117 RepID=A0ABW3B2A3_9FLAO
MNILTFDIEEWFHILDNNSTKTEAQWSSFEPRIHQNMDIIYDILEKTNVGATFFVVGWMAEKFPDVIRGISDRGYEIGSHTHLHQLVYEQDRTTFFKDVEKSIKTIEDCTGKKVTSFRAPGFSITELNKWAFEVLYELGITIDSSVFPASRAHGGLPAYKVAAPSFLEYNGAKLMEFPINTRSILGKPLIFSGGGYFRLLPYGIIKNCTHKSNYVMTYFHPRDFDYGQPVIKGLSPARQFKSYVGLKSCKPKLEKWLKDFNFIDLNSAIDTVDWSRVETVNLNETLQNEESNTYSRRTAQLYENSPDYPRN